MYAAHYNATYICQMSVEVPNLKYMYAALRNPFSSVTSLICTAQRKFFS